MCGLLSLSMSVVTQANLNTVIVDTNSAGLFGGPTNVCVNNVGTIAYVTDAGGHVWQMTIATGALIQMDQPPQPGKLWTACDLDSVNQYLWLTEKSTSQLWKVNLINFQFTQVTTSGFNDPWYVGHTAELAETGGL